jgi:hypothetical protein
MQVISDSYEYQCIKCFKKIKRDKEFIMTCPLCCSIMTIKKIEIWEK